MPPKKITIKSQNVNNQSKVNQPKKNIKSTSLKQKSNLNSDSEDFDDNSDDSFEDEINEIDEDIESEEEDSVKNDENDDNEKDSDISSISDDAKSHNTDSCVYKKVKNIIYEESDNNDDASVELNYEDDNINFDEIVKPEERISKPIMTIFERVRLLGDRANQLSLGAKPMIKGLTTMNPKEIAKLELENNVIPLIIERILPNGKKEHWHTSELKIIN
jgi:DNA-directed RNA polymerase subunit K/omega